MPTLAGKLSVFERVSKSAAAQQQLSKCGDRLDPEEEVLKGLFVFTRHAYGDKNSSTMAECRATKWKSMKKKSFIRLPPDADSLHQHCLRANYLAYIVRHPHLKCHPSPVGHGWELVDGLCRPIRFTRPALPTHLPALGLDDASEQSESDEEPGNDSSDSECSESEWSDSD